MRAAATPAVVEAAGALVWRVRRGTLQLALVHRPRYRDWSWPKGKLEPDETAVEAAAREVAEEIAQDVVLGMPLPSQDYKLRDGRTKHVRYWAAQVAGRSDAPAVHARQPVPPAARTEINDVRWFDVGDAARQLTRSSNMAPLDALVDAYAKRRLDTRALVVVRHGSARKRAGWTGTEADRPLTPDGQRQTDALVPLLSAFGVTGIVSSEWLRCAATVQPYAQAAGIPVRTSTALTELGHHTSPGLVAAEVADLVRGRHDVALCTHRPVLATVMDVIAEHSRRQVADELPTADPFLHPGEVLVAHVADTAPGPRVVATERHRGL